MKASLKVLYPTNLNVNVKRLPTDRQIRIAKRLGPYIEAHREGKLLPYGIFSRIARETGVTPAYITQIFGRLNDGSLRIGKQ
jgi:hypothetical protein